MNKKLQEEKTRTFMTNREKALKRKLISLLIDDGNGHHHSAYAKRLQLFDLNIVPLSEDPNFTAAISFDDGVIYVGEGFLTDPDTFFQLNVIIRHELAHNLMLHQLRMMNKLGNKYSKFSASRSLFDLLNIIADDEISNTRYSEADKKIVRNMFLNGRLIGGLVTEDHRKDWLKLPVEEMYEKIKEELDYLNNRLNTTSNTYRGMIQREYERSKDVIRRALSQTTTYKDPTTPSTLPVPVKDLLRSTSFKKAPPEIQKAIQSVYDYIYSNEFQKQPNLVDAITEEIEKIADSHPLEAVQIATIELNTPEEKALIMDILKKLREEFTDQENSSASSTNNQFRRSDAYVKQYNKIINQYDSKKYSTKELADLVSGLSAALNNPDSSELSVDELIAKLTD